MKEYIPNRVHFRFSRASTRGFIQGNGYRADVRAWLTAQYGPEYDRWMWMEAAMEIDHQQFDGFFIFEDENDAMMFKMMFG